MNQIGDIPRDRMQYAASERSDLCEAIKARDGAGLNLFWARVWGAGQAEIVRLEIEFEKRFRTLCNIEARERGSGQRQAIERTTA